MKYEKQLSRIKGSMLGSRQQRKENVNTLSNALLQYMIFQDKSSYIDELEDALTAYGSTLENNLSTSAMNKMPASKIVNPSSSSNS